MIKQNNNEILTVYDTNTTIGKIYKGVVKVYESWRKLIASGIPPITLLKCKGANLVDYKIYGNSIQKSVLPNEYQQVEYIESTGTQYIDTGVVLTSNLNISSTLLFTELPNSISDGVCPYGAFETNYSIYWRISHEDVFIGYCGSQYSTFFKIYVQEVIKLSSENGEFHYTNSEGNKKTASVDNKVVNATNNIYIFAQNVATDASRFASMRLYNFEMRDGENKLRNFVPCYRKSDNVIGLYDLVENKFYTNAGTGEFLKGNDVTPTPQTPIEVESVGEKTINLFNPEEVISKFESNDTYKSGSYTCTTIQLKPNTKYYMKTFNPTGSGYFYLSKNQGVSSSVSETIAVNDDSKNAYPRGFEKAVTTDSTGCLYIGFYSAGDKDERYRKLRENQIQIVEGSYTSATVPAYEPFGYKIPVRVRGKNFFNIDIVTDNNYIKKQDDGALIVSRYGVSTTQTLAQLCPELKVGDKVRLRCTSDAKLDGSSISLIYLNGANVNWRTGSLLTITQAHLDSRLTFYCSRNDGVNSDAYYKDIQIEYDKVTDYEPYYEPITTNIYLKEPLRKIYNFQDYIDFEKQKVVRRIRHNYITEIGSKSANLTTYHVFLLEIDKKPYVRYSSSTRAILTNKFTEATNYKYGELSKYPNSCLTYVTSGGANRVGITFDDETINTVELAQEALGDGVDINYVMKETITEDITLPNILLNKGTNIIEVDTNILPSNMEVIYLGKK